jgi:hypothetical protein
VSIRAKCFRMTALLVLAIAIAWIPASGCAEDRGEPQPETGASGGDTKQTALPSTEEASHAPVVEDQPDQTHEPSGPEPPPDSWPEGPQFETPTALIEYYNTTVSFDGRLNVRTYLGVIHAETPLQQRLVEMQRNAARWVDLMTAVQNRFRVQMLRAVPAIPVRRSDQPAMLAEQTGDRATAWYVDLEGEEQTLHLIRTGGTWRISARTIELLPEGRDVILRLDVMEPMFDAFGSIAPGIQRRLEAGEFGTVAEFGQAFDVAVAEYAANHPDARAAVQQFMDRNPAMFRQRQPQPPSQAPQP